ncbi:beta-galactosidase [Gluconobacter oxydans]|uniref:beta-galactosidase n=1 Tax=Gluconobacter oxydans TaxID=442 RepID=UPI0039E7720E
MRLSEMIRRIWLGLWLTYWGENDLARVEFTKDFSAIVAQGLSFNMYVVHGDTNFDFGAGANAHRDGSGFESVITSYDYDAPIGEAGCVSRGTRYYFSIIIRKAPPASGGIRP